MVNPDEPALDEMFSESVELEDGTIVDVIPKSELHESAEPAPDLVAAVREYMNDVYAAAGEKPPELSDEDIAKVLKG